MAENNYIDRVEVDGTVYLVKDAVVSASATTPKAAGTAAAGTETAYARGDHVHPKEVSDAERAAWNGKADLVNGKVPSSQLPDMGGYSKAQTLTAATAALFGLGASAVPNDVLAWLGKYAQNWWKRRINKTTQTTSQNSTYYIVDEDRDSERQFTVYYANAYTIQNGKFVLTSPSSTTISYDVTSNASKLRGKYCITGASSGSQMYKVPSSASVQTGEQGETVVRYSVWFNGCTYYYISQQTGAWEYVQSSDRSAYPDSGISGDYEYKYLGVPLDNAAKMNE